MSDGRAFNLFEMEEKESFLFRKESTFCLEAEKYIAKELIEEVCLEKK